MVFLELEVVDWVIYTMLILLQKQRARIESTGIQLQLGWKSKVGAASTEALQRKALVVSKAAELDTPLTTGMGIWGLLM